MYVTCETKTSSRSSQMKSAQDFGRVEIWKPLIDLADRSNTRYGQGSDGFSAVGTPSNFIKEEMERSLEVV